MSKIIAIEGTLGAGKTTLAKEVSLALNAKLNLESFKNNPFLPQLYEGNINANFPTEMYFLLDRISQLSNLQSTEYIISDYSIDKCLWFAKVNLSAQQYTIFESAFHEMTRPEFKPIKTIYLKQTVNQSMQHVLQRGRELEQNVSLSYLKKIHHIYQTQYISPNPNTLLIDAIDYRANPKAIINAVIDFIVKI